MVLSVYDCVRVGAFGVAAVVLAFQKTKRFLLVDALFNMSTALALILRPSLFQFQVKQPFDSLHSYLHQAAGCLSLLLALFYFFFVRSAKDDDASHGLLAARTLSVGLLTIITALNEWRFAGIFRDTFFPTLLLVSVMWTCLTAYHLYRTGVTAPRRGRIYPINLYIKIDIVLTVLMSIPDLLFSSYTKNFVSMSIDKVHEHLITEVAAVHFSTAILGIYAIGFRNVTERKGYLCCRVTALLLAIACLIYTVLVRKMVMTNLDLFFNLLILLPIINAIVGLVLTSDRRSFSSGSAGYNLRTRRS